MNKNIIIFDTNVLEGRYLEPILSKQPCRDIIRLKEKGYQPAISVKTLYEIWLHAKLGQGNNSRWQQKNLGYPGSLQDAVNKIITQLILDNKNAEKTGYFWFNQCEEWRYMDWDEELELIYKFMIESEQQSAIKELEIRKKFTAWKVQIDNFCLKIREELEALEFRIIYNHEVYSGQYSTIGFELEQELSLNSLVPNEDLEILFASIALNAVAFITCENKILERFGLSSGLNLKIPSLVHPNKFYKALEEDFYLRLYIDNST